MAPRNNLPALFLHTVREFARPDQFGARRADGWTWMSSQEALAAVREVAGGLVSLGLESGDRVALVCENRPEWIICDLAAQFAGGITVPVYPTLPADQAHYLLEDSGAAIAIASTADLVTKVQKARVGTGLRHIVGIDGGAAGAVSFESLRGAGRTFLADNPGALEERLASLGPDNLATIIYTSGTTGVPKGVMLSHGNICDNIENSVGPFRFTREEVAVSFLPLSHVLERMVCYAYLEKGVGIAFVRSLERLADALVEVRPHIFTTVPRLLERVAEKVKDQVEQLPLAKRTLGRRALRWADAVVPTMLAGKRPAGLAALRWTLADRILLSKVRAKLGGRLRLAICGGAALPLDVARFFWGAGVPVYEGYGMTETSPVIAVNVPGATKLGTVGRVIPGTEVRIAQDGEVVTRGPCVMKGYWRAELDAEEALRGGYMHTGDLGQIDGDGYLTLTGRKKEILVLSTGKNVAPRAIEEALERSPFISRVIAVGDERPSVGVLIVPDMERVAAWAAERRIPADDAGALLGHRDVRALFQAEIGRLQSNLATFEKARQFEFLDEPPSEDNGLLTPTQKVRRGKVVERYGHLVERMYQ